MTDVQRCDACGTTSRTLPNKYSFGGRATDIEASPEAVDIIAEGHLCDDCARKVAGVIKEIRRGNR
jgi:hypothetical protein